MTFVSGANHPKYNVSFLRIRRFIFQILIKPNGCHPTFLAASQPKLPARTVPVGRLRLAFCWRRAGSSPDEGLHKKGTFRSG